MIMSTEEDWGKEGYREAPAPSMGEAAAVIPENFQ